jgi:hypothetical protein
MIRLYSYYGLYSFLLIPPVSAVGITIWAININDKATLIMYSIMASLVLLFWLVTFRRCKRVYYENTSLYIYGPFSKENIIVRKDNIGGINRILSYDPRFYKIIYYDDNNDAHYVYFQRNWLLSNFNDIIDKLN